MTASRAADFEMPPDLPPSAVLPETLAAGENFQVVDPVHSDGLMRRFVLETRFGRYEAYGATALALRVNEVRALTQLAKTSGIAVVAGSVGRGVSSQVDTVASLVTHPVGTVTGIPKGVAHLFHGFIDHAHEALGSVKRATGPPQANGKSTSAAADAADAGKRYAARYLGVTGSERRWYEKLGVDPYTDNAPLRDAIHKKAKVEAAAGFGMRFVGVPGIAQIGDIRRAMDAIYKEDPATIRARDRVTLSGYGLTPAEIARWQNMPVFSPTRQMLLMQAAKSLAGVAGLGELFRHAFAVDGDLEAQVYLHSVLLLATVHARAPVAAIVAGVRLPAARRSNGRIIVCGAFDAVYWTAGVADGESQLRQALAGNAATGRELWIAGQVSDRARAELQLRGWEIHDGTGASAPTR